MFLKHTNLALRAIPGLVMIAAVVPVSETTASSKPLSYLTLNKRVQDKLPVAASDTLDKALAALPWDAEQQGPLLIVNPQTTTARPSAEPLAPAEPMADPNLRTLAARFNRQVFPLRSLTSLVPTTMVTLNSHPGKPDIYAGMLRSQKVKLLIATLTADQWRALGSVAGLGAGDLSDEQRPLFLSLPPEPFVLASHKMDKGHMFAQPDKDVTLTQDQRANVRLRVNRSVLIDLPQSGGNFGAYENLQYFGLPSGTEFYTLSNRFVPTSSAFGAVLRVEVPNRLKPGDLAFSLPLLNVNVPLAEAKNLGDLVRHIARATHFELIADERVAGLPVWTRGKSARAGDLLQVLCLAVTGTLRRVGSAYVLTSDLEGIGTRHARLADWAQDAQALRMTLLAAADKGNSVTRPEQYIHFAPDYPFAFSAAELQQLATNEPGKHRQDQYNLPFTSLPPAHQSVIQTFLTSQQETLKGDRIEVALRNVFSYIIPGMGAVDETYGLGMINLPAAPSPEPALPDTRVALPVEYAKRGLFVRLTNVREATQFAQIARRLGLNQLWVEVEEGETGLKLLRETITAAKQYQINVVAVWRLLQVGPADGEKGKERKAEKSDVLPEDRRDKNLLDETGSVHAARLTASPAGQHNSIIARRFGRVGDWLRSDSPVTLTHLQQRLREIATMPGLSGLAFRDMAPFGYLKTGSKPDPYVSPQSYEFAYTPAMRLAFLRQSGCDPIDLIGGYNILINADLSLPFFPARETSVHVNQNTGQLETQEGRTALQDWDAYRYKINTGLLASLHDFATKNYPDLPLMLRQAPISDGWWSGWDKTEKTPELNPLGINGESGAPQAAQASARPHLLNLSYAGYSDGKDTRTMARHFAQWLQQRLMQRGPGWSGIVLDLSALPAEHALNALEGLSPATPP